MENERVNQERQKVVDLIDKYTDGGSKGTKAVDLKEHQHLQSTVNGSQTVRQVETALHDKHKDRTCFHLGISKLAELFGLDL